MQKLKNVRLTGQPAGQKFSTGTGPGRDGRLPLPVTTMQETVGIYQGKSGDFPDVSSENSQTNGHNTQEMVGIHQERAGIHQEMVGIYQEKIRRLPVGILLPCSNVFSDVFLQELAGTI
jgi:hypothetical protein